MLQSEFFYRAFSDLTNADKEFTLKWSEFERWLESSPVVASPWSTDGSPLLRNLKKDWRLVGSGEYGTHSTLIVFMKECIDLMSKFTSDRERANQYASICKKFVKNGPILESAKRPEVTIRFCDDYLFRQTLSALNPFLRDEYDRKNIPVEEAASALIVEWDVSKFSDSYKLARDDVVFCTHNKGGHSIGDNPKDIVDSLALPLAFPKTSYLKGSTQHLFKLTYKSASVTNHRCPTFTDAGNFPYFNPINEDGPGKFTDFGWTKPLRDSLPPQPEHVHDNATLKVLTEPIRYVGSFVYD